MEKIDTIIISHGIKGYPHHYFSGGDLIQLKHFSGKRTKPQKILSKQLNGTCRGYFIDRKFKSLTWIEKRKYPITRVIINHKTKQWWEE